MKVKLKVVFSILDGRLSTKISDVYNMLDYIFSSNLMTHQLPSAMRKLERIRPLWFDKALDILNDIKKKHQTNDFQELMEIIDKEFSEYEIKLEKL